MNNPFDLTTTEEIFLAALQKGEHTLYSHRQWLIAEYRRLKAAEVNADPPAYTPTRRCTKWDGEGHRCLLSDRHAGDGSPHNFDSGF